MLQDKQLRKRRVNELSKESGVEEEEKEENETIIATKWPTQLVSRSNK